MAGSIRIYTKTRRYPIMIGKFPNGKPIPGGPYTLPQFAAAALGFLLTIWLPTKGIFPIVPCVIGCVMLTFAAVRFLGIVPSENVSIVSRGLWFFRHLLSRGAGTANPITVDSHIDVIDETEMVVLDPGTLPPPTSESNAPETGRHAVRR